MRLRLISQLVLRLNNKIFPDDGNIPGGDGFFPGFDPSNGFIGFDSDNGIGSLKPKEFLDTGSEITRFGCTEDIGDFADNGDWANNGDWSLGSFGQFIIGEGLPDVGDIEVTVGTITTTMTFDNGFYVSDDPNAELIFYLISTNIGVLINFDIQLAQPVQTNLTVGKYDFDFGGGIIEYKGVAPENVLGSPGQNPAFGSLSPTNYLGLEVDALISAFNPAFGIAVGQFGNTVSGVADLGDINVIVDGVPYLFTYEAQQNNYLADGAVAEALFNALQDGQSYTLDVQLAS